MTTIEKIQHIYKVININFLERLLKKDFNHKQTRSDYKISIENIITGIEVQCDEENNFPDVLENNCLVATIRWNESHRTRYCILVFGK